MKDYIIEVKDGHHHVRMLSDEEIQIAKRAAEFFNSVLETVREVVENIVGNLKAWIEENNIIELLEEYENELNTGKIQPAIGDTSRIRQSHHITEFGRLTDGVVHGTDRMGEHSRTL